MSRRARRFGVYVALAAPLGCIQGDVMRDLCWGLGYSRALCCGPDPIIPCFSYNDEFSEQQCCQQTYDPCFLIYLGQASDLNNLTCDEFRSSKSAWLSRDCFSWLTGDWQFERTVVTDLLEADLARCFHVTVRVNGRSWIFGVCTPRPCTASDLEADIFTFVDLHRLTLTEAGPANHPNISAEELVPWGALSEQIQFVIAGFPNSGTSSLVKTLADHPEISLTLGEVSIPQAKIIEGWGPMEHDITDWRAWLCAELLPKRFLLHDLPSKTFGKVTGIKNPLLLYSDRCVRGLARAMPKLLVLVRDPLEWILSIFKHNASLLGFALQDWRPPPPGAELASYHGSWFGRDHARFGSLLDSVLRSWQSDRVLVIELEHLRRAETAVVVLDAVCRFLGVTPFSNLQGLPIAISQEKPASWLQYARGFGSSSRSWTDAQLCAPGSALFVQVVAHSLSSEYEILPRLLARVGVVDLGVSAVISAGGAFVQRCRQEFYLPGASMKAAGLLEQAVKERRIRVTWRGEIGIEFKVLQPLSVATLGCGAGEGPLRQATHVILWDTRSRYPLWVSRVTPDAPIWEGFAFGPVTSTPMMLKGGVTYVLTVQVFPGLGISPAVGTTNSISRDLAEFTGGVFSNGPWVYPYQRDPNADEEAYTNLVTFRVAR